MKLLDYVAFGAATAQTPGFRLNTDALTLDYGDSEYIDLVDLERGKKKNEAKKYAWHGRVSVWAKTHPGRPSGTRPG